MESTGPYWKPVFNVLEEGGLEVVLANPQQVKNLRGHKTDMKDCWWLAHLLRHGMIRPSYIPSRRIRELRDLTRYRAVLVDERTREKSRLEKELEDAGIKLSLVASDPLGVSGRAMLEALIAGQRDPKILAQNLVDQCAEQAPRSAQDHDN